MGTTKCLSLIYEVQNFGNTYLGKVSKFLGQWLVSFWASEPFTGLEVKKHPPSLGADRVNDPTFYKNA